jgi:hypothetical protein
MNGTLFESSDATKANARSERASEALNQATRQHHNLGQSQAQRRFINALGAMVGSDSIDTATAVVILRIARGGL